MEKEYDVSLMELLYYVLCHWRGLVCWMLVTMLLLDVFGSYRDYRKQSALSNQPQQAVQGVDDSDVTEGLSKQEIEVVDDTFVMYQKYRDWYRNTEKYFDDSILMQIDARHVPTFTLQFYVDNHYRLEYPSVEGYNNVSDIVTSYSDALQDDVFFSDVASALEWEKDITYLGELVQIQGGQERGYFSVVVNGAAEEEARQLGRAVETQILGITERLQDVFGEFDLHKVGESYAEIINDDILSRQQAMISALNNFNNVKMTIAKSLSEAQQTYFFYLVEKECAEDRSQAEEDRSGIEEAETDPENAGLQQDIVKPVFTLFHTMYILIGLILGLLAGCIYYAILYILSTRLRTADDLQSAYQLHVIGTYRDMRRQNKKVIGSGIDEILAHIFRKDSCVLGMVENVRRICTEIEIAATKNAWKCVHLTGASSSDVLEALLADIQKELSAKGLKVTTGKSVVFDTDSLESLTNADAVVLVEQLERSKYSHIEGEMNICRQYAVPVIGAVVVE